MNYQFISSLSQLEDTCRLFEREKKISVDLEADSMHCFHEKICLIQIASKAQAFLIDPFEIKEIAPFLDVLENPQIMKVFHGADFDIRSLDRDYGIRVRNLFDTEIACRFIGIKERGLAALLKKYFNVTADKRFQKVDWSRRPLTDEMIEYSVMDVTFLDQLRKILEDRLVGLDRLSWAKEEFEIQEQVRYENNHVPPLFIKFKGAGKMDNRSLAVLENLLALRIDIAQEKDRPLFKVFSNASLKTMAEKKPVSIDAMLRIKALSKKQADMYGEKCCKAVANAVELPFGKLPSYPKKRRPKEDKKVKARIKSLKKMRENLSIDLDLEPGFLLNNALISAIAAGNPKTGEELLKTGAIRNWQARVLKKEILAVLSACP